MQSPQTTTQSSGESRAGLTSLTSLWLKACLLPTDGLFQHPAALSQLRDLRIQGRRAWLDDPPELWPPLESPVGITAPNGLRRLFLKRAPGLVAIPDLRAMPHLTQLHLGCNADLSLSLGPGGGLGGASALQDLRLHGTPVRTQACADAVLALCHLTR